MRLLVERDGASLEREGSLQDEDLALEFAVCPVDDDDGPLELGEEGVCHGGVDALALAVEMSVSEQAVDGLDVMLYKSSSGAMTAQFGQRESASSKGCIDYSNESIEARPVGDTAVAREPAFQQAKRVHVVLSGRDGCVVTPIGSDDDMHVYCLSA